MLLVRHAGSVKPERPSGGSRNTSKNAIARNGNDEASSSALKKPRLCGDARLDSAKHPDPGSGSVGEVYHVTGTHSEARSGRRGEECEDATSRQGANGVRANTLTAMSVLQSRAG